MDLNTSIQQFNTYRSSSGYSRNTVRTGAEALNAFMAVTGNIQCKSLGPQHGEMYLASMLTKGYAPTTVNLRLSMVKSFIKWLGLRRLIGPQQNPLGTVRYQKVDAAPRRRVPVKDFARLLDAAEHPQTRILVALGLYLFLRSSEIIRLKLEHVDLDLGEIRAFQPKTSRWDVMPICAELDEELRRWLTWYANDQGTELDPDWFLVPARRQRTIALADAAGADLAPTRKITRSSAKVHDALRGIGWRVSGADMEGVHTLRRSGARALFDDLVERDDRARDDALRIVSAMLHHKSVTQTETYLGLEADREKRDLVLRGRRMFAEPERTNVVALPKVVES